MAVDDGAQGDRLFPFDRADFPAAPVQADLQPRMLGEYDVERLVDEPDGGEWLIVSTRRKKRPGGYECLPPEEQWPMRTLHRCVEPRQQTWFTFQYDEEQRVSEVVAIADNGTVSAAQGRGYILRGVVVPFDHAFSVDTDSHFKLRDLRDSFCVVTRHAECRSEETDYPGFRRLGRRIADDES